MPSVARVLEKTGAIGAMTLLASSACCLSRDPNYRSVADSRGRTMALGGVVWADPSFQVLRRIAVRLSLVWASQFACGSAVTTRFKGGQACRLANAASLQWVATDSSR